MTTHQVFCTFQLQSTFQSLAELSNNYLSKNSSETLKTKNGTDMVIWEIKFKGYALKSLLVNAEGRMEFAYYISSCTWLIKDSINC